LADILDGRFTHPPVALLEGGWWEEGRVSQEDGLLKAKIATKVRNLCLMDVAIQ